MSCSWIFFFWGINIAISLWTGTCDGRKKTSYFLLVNYSSSDSCLFNISRLSGSPQSPCPSCLTLPPRNPSMVREWGQCLGNLWLPVAQGHHRGSEHYPLCWMWQHHPSSLAGDIAMHGKGIWSDPISATCQAGTPPVLRAIALSSQAVWPPWYLQRAAY